MEDPKKLYEDLSLESVYDEKGIRTLWKDMTSKNKMEQIQKISSAMLSATNFVYNGEASDDTNKRNLSVCEILEKEIGYNGDKGNLPKFLDYLTNYNDYEKIIICLTCCGLRKPNPNWIEIFIDYLLKKYYEFLL